MAATQLSIVIPCYNPPVQWFQGVISNYQRLQAAYPGEFELIIVNDGSTLNCPNEQLNEHLQSNKTLKLISYTQNQGKGYALRQGVKTAVGEYIIYTDVDFPYTFESFQKVYNELKAGAQVVIGVRGPEYYTHLPKTRVRISKFLRFLIKSFLRIPTDDTQCGLKGFNASAKPVFLQTTINRYLFDLEFIFIAAKAKLNFKMVNVQLRDEVQLSSMNWNILLQESSNFIKIFLRSIF